MNRKEYDILKKLSSRTDRNDKFIDGFPKLYGGGEFKIKVAVPDQNGSGEESEIKRSSFIVMERLGKTLKTHLTECGKTLS